MASLSVAATAAAISASSSSSSSSSSSIDPLSFNSVNFPFKFAKPLKFSKQRPNLYLNSLPFSVISRSLFFCSSAAFDGAEATQSTEPLEEEEEEEEEEEALTEEEEEEQEQEEQEEGTNDAVVSESAEARRLYVGNLPFAMTSAQLADVFSEAGRVPSVEVVYDRVTDRSRGFAFVTMGSVQEAEEAIRLFDGSQVGGRTIKVNFPEVPRGGEREVMGQKIRSSYQGFVDSPHKVYAGNLSWNLTSQGLREAFQDQPGYLSAKIIYDRDTGRSRGFGFISFDSAEAVESALSAMNGVEIEGRPLRLNVAEQRSPLTPRGPPPEIETNPTGVTESSDLETNPETISEGSEVFSSISS